MPDKLTTITHHRVHVRPSLFDRRRRRFKVSRDTETWARSPTNYTWTAWQRNITAVVWCTCVDITWDSVQWHLHSEIHREYHEDLTYGITFDLFDIFLSFLINTLLLPNSHNILKQFFFFNFCISTLYICNLILQFKKYMIFKKMLVLKILIKISPFSNYVFF